MARHVESTASAMGIASALCREIISAPQGSIRTVPFRLIQSLYVIAQTQQLQQEGSKRLEKRREYLQGVHCRRPCCDTTYHC
jgi:hypothetical protein